MEHRGESLEKIIWTIIFILFGSSSVAHAECNESSLHDKFSTVRQYLLEGSVKQAQGVLFDIREHIHCHYFSHDEYQIFLFYTGIYHHLLSDPNLAEHYFMGSNPRQHPEFGDTIQKYANAFTTSKAKWQLRIKHSNFQILTIDGHPSKTKIQLPKGTHLLQLKSKKDKRPVYSQWFTVEENHHQRISVPRFAPKWPLYIGGTKALLAGYSLYMVQQKSKEAQLANSEEEYRSAIDQRASWIRTSAGFSALSLTFFGIYYVW